MSEINKPTDISVLGFKEYVDMLQRISRLEKFEEQIGSRVERFEEKISMRLTVRDEEIDEKFKNLEEQMDKQHKATGDLIRAEVNSVKTDLKQDARLSTDSIERRQEVIRSEIGSTKAELRCDVKVVSDSIDIKHSTLTSEVKEIHETMMKFAATVKAVVAIGGLIAATLSAGTWVLSHKDLIYSLTR